MANLKLKQIDFSNGKTFHNIVASAIPMLVGQLLTLLYSVVDRIYIGRMPGDGVAALAGIGICFPVIILVSAVTNLFGQGGAPLCAIEEGRGDMDMAEHILNTSFRLLVLSAFLIMVIVEVFASPILTLFGAAVDTMPYALAYLRIYMLGTLFTMLASGLNPYLSAQGFPGMAMLSIAVGSILNLILDPIFIFLFGMGVRGAAVATVISQIFSCAVVLRFFLSEKSPAVLRLRIRRLSEIFSPDWALGGKIAGLGASSCVMQCTNSLVSIVCNSVLMQYGGSVYVSVMTVVTSVRSIVDTPVLAFGDGASPVLSFNYGAERPERVRRGIAIMTTLCLSYTLVVWLAVRFAPRLFIAIFTDDAALMEDAVPALHLYFFAFIFQAMQISGQTVFKALNKKKCAIFFSILRKVVLVVPLTLLLPGVGGMGTDGVFIAEPISNFVGGCACFFSMLAIILPELARIGKRKKKAETTGNSEV